MIDGTSPLALALSLSKGCWCLVPSDEGQGFDKLSLSAIFGVRS